MKTQGKGTLSVICAIILIVLACCTGIAGAEQAPTFKYPYGVFLSICENIEQFADYEIVVIDAQYYPKEELDAFRSKGHKVFSYINVGSRRTSGITMMSTRICPWAPTSTGKRKYGWTFRRNAGRISC